MPLRPARSESFQVKAKEAALLRQLARGYNATPEAVLSHLIREAYAANVKELKVRAGFGFALGAGAAKKPATKKARAKKAAGKNAVATAATTPTVEAEKTAKTATRRRAKQ